MIGKEPLYEFGKLLLAYTPINEAPYCNRLVLALPSLAKTEYAAAIEFQRALGGMGLNAKDPYADLVETITSDHELPAYVRELFAASADACDNPEKYPNPQRYVLHALRSTMNVLAGYDPNRPPPIDDSDDEGGILVPEPADPVFA